MGIRYFEHKELVEQLRAMWRAGGQSQKAANQVYSIRQQIRDGVADPFKGVPQTNNGESRIDHCVKYDLSGFCRLVTIRPKNFVCLLYAGTHEDVDRWLENRRGMTPAVSEEGSLVEVQISKSLEEPKKRIAYKPGNLAGPLVSQLDQGYRDRLLGDLPTRVTEPLRDISAGVTEEQLLLKVSSITDVRLRTTVFDVFLLLNSDNIKGAQHRIDLELPLGPHLTPVAELDEDQILRISGGDTMRDIEIGSAEYESWINQFQKTANEFDWFLFMHPEQEKYVKADYSGPAKLSGVSGSGKTCIAIRRAMRLAEKYLDGTIAILTLNRSLAYLISSLMDHVCPPTKGRGRIKAYSFFQLCQELLAEFEPENARLYSDVTWGLEEHIDEIFREFYRCQANYTKAAVLRPIHKSLTSLGIDAETFIRDEFDWIRSAVAPDNRAQYLDIERSGRVYPITKSRREPILETLFFWEEKMKAIGVIDYVGLTTALHRHFENIRPRFRSIIVDEAQDFGTSELGIIRRLVPPSDNDLFLCGDLAQHILPKHQKFAEAQIDVLGRCHTIKRNYRNTREILRAAYNVLYDNLDEELMRAGEMEILDPEYATRSASIPIVLKASTLEEEIAFARSLMADNARQQARDIARRPHRGCIVIAGFTFYEIKIFADRIGLPVLDGTQDATEGELYLSDLEQTKGYEFDTVAILNCAAEVLPPTGAPPEETFRYACQLYVAMTRARDQLVLSHSGIPSRWLLDKPSLGYEDWQTFFELSEIACAGQPGFLPEFPDAEDPVNALMEATGKEFIYTVYARGLPAEAQDKLEELVSGTAVLRGGHRVQWENVGQLLDDMRNRPRAGYIFGPATEKIVLNALETAAKGGRHTARISRKKREIKIRPLPDPIYVQKKPGGMADGKLSVGVADLNIDSHTIRYLQQANVATVGDLLKVSSFALRRSPNFGQKRIEVIRGALQALGYEW